MSELIKRLKSYRPFDGEWGDKAHHTICDEAADALEARDKIIAELVAAIDEGVQVSTPDLMDWVADRLVFVYHESQNVDYVQSLRSRAQKLRLASSKAQSKDKAE